jgi:hypothetical protein
MVNYVDLWLMHSHVASFLDDARLELRELKARSTLFGACTTCPLLRSDLEVAAIEIKDLKYKFGHSSRYTILSPPCEACVSLKGKLFYAIKENTELQQEVTYLTTRLEKPILSEKMIEKDLTRVEESATKFTYRLGIGFEKSATKVIRSDNVTEFRNASSDEFYLEHGIDQQFSTPCVPQQNGVMEQKNRTLVEMARMMLDKYRTVRRF